MEHIMHNPHTFKAENRRLPLHLRYGGLLQGVSPCMRTPFCPPALTGCLWKCWKSPGKYPEGRRSGDIGYRSLWLLQWKRGARGPEKELAS